MLKKNEKHRVAIEGLTGLGSGFTKINGMTVFVENAVPGDIVELLIVKVKKTYAYGKITEIIVPSSDREVPRCPVQHQCGGCSLMQVAYSSQIYHKQKQIVDALVLGGGYERRGIEALIEPTAALEIPYHYRNKVVFPVREVEGAIKVGFFKKNSHIPVDFYDCHIQQSGNKDLIDAIIKGMKTHGISAYNEDTHTGLIRGIFIREGHVSGERMVALIVNSKNFVPKPEFLEGIEAAENILINYNTKKDNTLLSHEFKVVKGRDYIEDTIGETKFQIALNAFYQINGPLCAQAYEEILSLCELTGEETVLDAYCGIGTIALYVAKQAKAVYGIEVVPEAIVNATANAQLNGITNAQFTQGLAEEKIKDYPHMDVAILDPPRKGVDPAVIETLRQMKPKKLIYLSCNPLTLARDLKLLKDMYQLKTVKGYDFFAHSAHVETLVSLERI